MSDLPLFDKSKLQEAFAALKQDLIHEDGPRVSTMRNYRFAIVRYAPADEFKLRSEVQRLTSALTAHGWHIITVDLQALLFKRIRAKGEAWGARVAQMETRLAQVEASRGLNYLKSKLTPLIEDEGGIAKDCARIIQEEVERRSGDIEHTLAFIGRAGALYPFSRSSALLRYLDGQTRNVPVILLYPGEQRGPTSLSFMGELEPDKDYRPRIYA